MPPPLIAALVYPPGFDTVTLLASIVDALRAAGPVRLGGVIHPADDIGSTCSTRLVNLATGSEIPADKAPTAEADTCLDPDLLARGAMAVAKAIDDGVDLVVINKFGAQEAAGAGLRSEFAHALLAGVPVLTAVSERLLPQWAEFTGGDHVALKPELDAVLTWWQQPRAGS